MSLSSAIANYTACDDDHSREVRRVVETVRWWEDLEYAPDPPTGDPHWKEAHHELGTLHADKSSTYGTTGDRFANFTGLAAITGQEPERYVAERMIEKLVRVVNMLDADRGNEVAEWPDLASLALCGEALRRRRAT